MKILHIIAPLFLLAACETPAPQHTERPSLPPTERDFCNANQNGALIGQDATALEDVLIMQQVRIIRPGQPVTMDMRPERINFFIDADNRIESITCG